MPKRGTRKTRKRRAGRSSSSSSFQPKQKRVLLKWIGTYNENANNLSYAWSWQMNAPLKPDSSSSFTTPGFSEVAAFYSMYRTTKFRAKIRFISETQEATGSPTEPVNCIAFFSDAAIGTAGGGAGTDLLFISALPANRAKRIQLNQGNTGQSVGTISFPWRTVKSIWGESPFISDTYSAATNTVPSRGCFLNVGLYYTNGAAANNESAIEVELEFDSIFFEYIDSLTSLDTKTQKIAFYNAGPRKCAACVTLIAKVFDQDPTCSCGNTVICSNCDSEFLCNEALRSPLCKMHSFRVSPKGGQEQSKTLTTGEDFSEDSDSSSKTVTTTKKVKRVQKLA